MGSGSSETGASARRADGAADSRGPHVREKEGAHMQDERGAGELGLVRLAGLRRGVWAGGKGARVGPTLGFGPVWVSCFLDFTSLFFSKHTQTNLNSNEFEFKLLCTQTKKTYAPA